MRAHKKVFTYTSINVTIFSQRCLQETKQRIKEVTLSFEIKKPAGNKKGDARNSIDNQVIMGRRLLVYVYYMYLHHNVH